MMPVVLRERKSAFVKLFDKTPDGVLCPHFYELVLSNGCPYDCTYCYLRLTFRGNKQPSLFTNQWPQVKRQIESAPDGVFSTGELADSIAVMPPLLLPALDYFRGLHSKYLLLTTKSSNIGFFRDLEPTRQVIISFSINSPTAASAYEHLAPPPVARLKAAAQLLTWGWRVRIRLDPIIWEVGLENYQGICREIAQLQPERVTIGTLRQYPGLFRFAREAPRQGLSKAPDGRMRYSPSVRREIYEQIQEWLGFQPALCKETADLWDEMALRFSGCNCTV